MNSNSDKPIILCFTDYFLPGFRAGGALRTIVNFVDRFGLDFDIRIVTCDRDFKDSKPFSCVQVNTWNIVGNASVLYVSPDRLTLWGIANILSEFPYDVLYLNSFFSTRFTTFPLLVRFVGVSPRVPCVIAPRGEFSTGALALKSIKKILYIAVTSLFGLYRDLTWQASSTRERDDILRVLSYVRSCDIHVAPDLASVSRSPSTQFLPSHRSQRFSLRLCFLSRISPMKNLDFALRVLAHVRANVIFTIYGPKEDPDYWLTCKGFISKLPDNIDVVYKGEVHPQDVKFQLSQHDLFFLPSRGENYGHVIYEALDAGLPVLISDQTPWSEVEAFDVGWTLPLDDEILFAQRIDHVSSWSINKFASVRKSAQAFARSRSLAPDVLEANRNLFLNLL